MVKLRARRGEKKRTFECTGRIQRVRGCDELEVVFGEEFNELLMPLVGQDYELDVKAEDKTLGLVLTRKPASNSDSDQAS
jgi:hypothetical protein